MQWNTLLSKETVALRKEGRVEKRNQDSIFESDYQIIVTSSAFRRLQDKTQVFPLDKSDFVRTRLTHSVETSTIAKQLGSIAYKNVLAKSKGDCPITAEEAQHICEVLLCAGVIHDLGNPPFGHFGEALIGKWFQDYFEKNENHKIHNEQMRYDLEYFNGNAQNIRLIAKSCAQGAKSELNLTYSVVQTLLKYPITSSTAYTKNKGDKKSKFGYFYSEQEFVKNSAQKTGVYEEGGRIARHPLTSLLEAADDICYATADLEDAFKKECFTLDEFIHFYILAIKDLAEKKEKKQEGDLNELKKAAGHSEDLVKYLGKAALERFIASEKFTDEDIAAWNIEDIIKYLGVAAAKELRSKTDDAVAFNGFVKYVRPFLTNVAAFSFSKHYPAIMDGTYTSDLFCGTYHELSIKALKGAMPRFVYDSEMIVRPELSAQTILTFLLDRFVSAVLCEDENSSASKKYWNLIPANFRKDYEKENTTKGSELDRYFKLLMVTDFISGMTDSYAKNLYQELNGIV